MGADADGARLGSHQRTHPGDEHRPGGVLDRARPSRGFRRVLPAAARALQRAPARADRDPAPRARRLAARQQTPLPRTIRRARRLADRDPRLGSRPAQSDDGTGRRSRAGREAAELRLAGGDGRPRRFDGQRFPLTLRGIDNTIAMYYGELTYVD